MTLNRMGINRSVLGVMIFGLLVGGCADKAPPATSNGTAVSATPIVTGTALPPGYKIDSGRTLILGADDKWTGRVSYTSSMSADDVFDFLRREMPNFGWAETTAMRSDASLLTFTSDTTGRVATIFITRGSMLGGSTRVDMVVSPRDTSPPTKSTMPTIARQPAH